MNRLAVLSKLVHHLQTGDVSDSTEVHQRHCEGSGQRDRPVRDWERLLQRESQSKAGDLLHLRVDVVDEEAVELMKVLGLKLGRWSVSTERVVAAREGRGAVAVQMLGSVRTQSNRILSIRLTLRRR